MDVYTMLLITITFLSVGGQKCCLKNLNETTIRGFTIHGESIPMRTKKIEVIPCSLEDTFHCFLQTSDLLTEIPNTTAIIYFAFKCHIPRKVILTSDYDTQHTNLISYLDTDNCIFSSTSLSVIATVTKLTVLGFYGYATVYDNENCSYLTNVGSLVVSNTKDPPTGIDFLYSCQEEISFIGELILRNHSLTELPSNMSNILPTLQYLDVAMNNLTTPPVFPWNDNARHLPMNLSRAPFFHSVYSMGGALLLANNEYKREFRLDYNPYLDINGHSFRGYLQLLSLAGCRIKLLHANLFSNVTGLQYLDLSKNMIEFVSSDVLVTLIDLRILDLSYNKLANLQGDFFQRQKKILSINLSNNRIRHLESGLFAGLNSLQILNLENNRIDYVNENAFSRENNNLGKLILTNNPIATFPDSLLHLYNLYDIGLQGNNITSININSLFSDKDSFFELVSNTLVKSSLSNLRTIDLSNGATKTLLFHLNEESSSKLVFLLKYYKFILDNNPLSCDCYMANVMEFVMSLKAGKGKCGCFNMTLSGTEYPFTAWKCAKPNDLNGEFVLSLDIRETYCPVYRQRCPERCLCYKRSEINTIIVDCRDANLTHVPQIMPTGKLELLLEGNRIQHFILPEKSCEAIVKLNIEGNGLLSLDLRCLYHMKNLRMLHINNNRLMTLPKEIQDLPLEKIYLGNNVFQCDCHSLWIKEWFLKHKQIIGDSEDVKCVGSVEETGRNIEHLPDDQFVCKASGINVLTLSFVIFGGIAFLFLLVTMVVYMNWKRFKLCLYIYTGAHPFDKQDEEETLHYDAFVVYHYTSSAWVEENIVSPLERDYPYQLFTVSKNFKFGQSQIHNIQEGINKSKRLIVFLSHPSVTCSLIQQSIEEGMNRCKEKKANFVIPVLLDIDPKDIDNKHLQKYIKRRTLIDTRQPDFLKRIAYFMPRKGCAHNYPDGDALGTNEEPRFTFVQNSSDLALPECRVESGACHPDITSSQPQVGLTSLLDCDDIILEEPINEGCLVFIWYADEDFDFMMKKIVHPFERSGHRFILADKNFLPGTTIQENILKAIDHSHRTVIILSQASVENEWILYAFRNASQRFTSDKTFLMGLLVRGDIEEFVADEEIKKHLIQYTPLAETDEYFMDKMKVFLASS